MKISWVDLGPIGGFYDPRGVTEKWQDHGLGLLRTILHQNNIRTEVCSLRAMRSWEELPGAISNADMLLMNVRSYTFPDAVKVARLFKSLRPEGVVIVGGMHATVALDEMEVIKEFDYICQGPGENIIVNLVTQYSSFPRVVKGVGSKSMSDWPVMDRALWPQPKTEDYPWPLESSVGFGAGPVGTVLTSRVCPWRCSFCNEMSFIPNMGRRSVDQVIDELNFLDEHYGPLGSVVIHDSMFFQHPSWLEEWLDKYPRKANKVWPYWAAARSDTIRKRPDLFEALILETNWNTISIGLESGSDKVLKILNKECTAEDNLFCIDLVNRIGDDLVAKGQKPAKLFANIILATPGETKEDVFATVKMLWRMKYVMTSIAYFAPYPGSALGNQIIAEGKSLMSKDDYHRYPGVEKVKGVNYEFYAALMRGEYLEEIKNWQGGF